jgi:hypothetical protein
LGLEAWLKWWSACLASARPSKCKALSSNSSIAKEFYKKIGHMVSACNPSYLEGRGRRILSSRSVRAKLTRPYFKNIIQKRTVDIAQVVENLPSIYESLDSVPRTERKKGYANGCGCAHM